MKYPSTEFENCIARLCENKANEDELIELRELLLSNEKALEEYLAYTDIHSRLAGDPTLGFVLESTVSMKEINEVLSQPMPKTTTNKWIKLGIAAALLIGFFLIYNFDSFSNKTENFETAEMNDVHYAVDIEPILEQHCYKCHGQEKQKAGLRLDLRAAMLDGGKSGKPVLIVGNGAESEIVKRIRSHDPEERMPEKGDGLSDLQVKLISDWIDKGAKWH